MAGAAYVPGVANNLAAVPERADLQRRTTELLQRLIRFDTVNPPGNEAPAQEWLRGLLEAAGFDCELLAAVPGRPNLIARLRSGSDGPSLCLLGHVDTVLADPAEWSVDPWSGELRDGCVWGRGAIDMKSQVAAELAAALALAEEGWRPEAGELMLVFTADEETGAVEGAQWLCREHPDRVRADLVVNEGAGAVIDFDGRRVYPVCVAEKGVFRFKLTTEGRAGHASVPRIGDNAIVKLGPVLTALGERRPSSDPTPELEALLSGLGLDPSDPAAALEQVEASDPRLAVLLEPMLGVSMSPTIVSAGEKINVIPSRAELQVDCRVPPELGRPRVTSALARADRRGRLRARVRRGRNRQPLADGHTVDGLDPLHSSSARIPAPRWRRWSSPASPTRIGGAPLFRAAWPTASSLSARSTRSSRSRSCTRPTSASTSTTSASPPASTLTS